MKVLHSLLASMLLFGIGHGQEGCDVEDKSVPVISYDKFTENEVKISAPTRFKNEGDVLLVPFEAVGGTSGQVWVKKQERISDGFILTAEVSMQGSGDGFALIAQNDAISSVMGATGPNLGFRDALQNYIAVGFESCPGILNVDCPNQTVTLYEHLGDGFEWNAIATAPLISHNVSDGEIHFVRMVYSELKNMVKVIVWKGEAQKSQVISGTLSRSAKEIFKGSRFGYFGVTASTSAAADFFKTADILVHSLKLDQQPPDTMIVGEVGERLTWGVSFIFKLSMVDSCQKPVKANDQNKNISAIIWYDGKEGFDNFTRSENPIENVDFFYPDVTFNDLLGLWEIRFDSPPQIEGIWTLDVSVDNIPSIGMPLQKAAITIPVVPDEGIPTWGLALLIIIIILIILGLIYAIYRLRRYRQKLKENQEDIEAGKEKHKLDMLDRDIEYNVNPMLGTIEEMRQKLKENEAELERLRNGKQDLNDDNYTIENLQQQNEELREEMNKLKIEAQQQEALNANYRSMGPAAPVKKKEFDQTRTS